MNTTFNYLLGFVFGKIDDCQSVEQDSQFFEKKLANIKIVFINTKTIENS